MTEKETSWETQEVITWLINDEGCYDALYRESARQIKAYVLEGYAPAGLYEGFNQPPKSKWDDVDWNAVENALAEE